jgi:hypothetical protein
MTPRGKHCQLCRITQMCYNKWLRSRVWTETDVPIGAESEQTQIEKEERQNRHSCKEEASELN